uniref:Coilin tudor domain-containing protein n=1 Tax=Oncorhynchus tshawytscha TaxID=74940 RepID=A0AAZ3Q9M0_ONCTS
DRAPRRGGEWDRDSRGGRGRGEDSGAGGGDNAGFYFNYEGGQRQQTHQPPSYQKDSLINSSVVFQNPSESVPKRDYSEMPLLAAPPQDGQKIAFKLLELTENYTPEVSEYKRPWSRGSLTWCIRTRTDPRVWSTLCPGAPG